MTEKSLPPFVHRFFDFYWKKKRTFLRSARRRGFDLQFRPKVPTAGITGSVGKTTTSRMVAHILARTGLRVALSTTQGAFVGEEVLRRGDLAGGESAGRLLVDPRVQAGVFELARGGLISDGMILSAIDVGAVLNVYDNHIGLNGVNSREDLARVKGEVVQRARRLAVLNADDPLCLGMAKDVTAKVCLVSAESASPDVAGHMARGGLAVVLDDDGRRKTITLFAGKRRLGSLDAAAIPAAHGGLFRPVVSNAMFAVAIAHGLGVDWQSIADALADFHSTCESNPGRMNFLRGFPFTALLTWADGPQAMHELAEFARRWPAVGRKHLMLTAAGNRPDGYILEMARTLAGVFDSYICADWDDLRGRKPGETSGLLSRGLREAGVPDAAVRVSGGLDDGLREAFACPAPGDFLVLVTYSGDKAMLAAESRRLGVAVSERTKRA